MGDIYLIRHGETDWNWSGQLQGLTDVPLNGAGRAQARHLRQCLLQRAIGCVFTSPLRRARDTAQMSRGLNRWPVITEDDLREIDHGVWTGLKVSEIERRLPDDFACWQSDPEKLRVKGGDSWENAYRRVARFLSRITAMAGGTNVGVVSHGVVNALIICAATGSPFGRLRDFTQPNASILVLRVRNRQIDGVKGFENGVLR